MGNPALDEVDDTGEVGEGENYTNGVVNTEIVPLVDSSNNSGTELVVSPVTDSVENVEMMNEEEESKETESTHDVSTVSSSVMESDGIEDSPKKISSSCSDSESDASSDKVPAKRRKKNNGNASALRHHQQLRKSMVPFIQKKECEKLKQNLGKCLECRRAPKFGRKGKDSVCRFLAFRKLRYTKSGAMTVNGFPDAASDSDYTLEDLNLWRPHSPPEGMTVDLAKFLLREVGDQFCHLVKQEKETLVQLKDQDNKTITWRRVVKNLRELCDVCSTTLFNYHWTCERCGFVVCVSCFNVRKIAKSKEEQTSPKAEFSDRKDAYGWLKCHAHIEHELKYLMLTQIVAGKALDDLWSRLHQYRRCLRIPEDCGCESPSDLQSSSADNNAPILRRMASSKCEPKAATKTIEPESTKSGDSDDEDEDGDDQDGLMDLFGNNNPKDDSDDKTETIHEADPTIVDESESSSMKQEDEDESIYENKCVERVELKNFIRKGGTGSYTIKVVPKVIGSHMASSKKYKHVPHSWLCQGYLLRLMDPQNSDNLLLFQEQWKRGQPVIVSNVGTKLDRNLWSPESFSRDFGSERSNLINCMTGKLVPNRKMKEFWDGFEHVKKRLQGENGEPMLLKLKDWPPGDDFAQLLPDRFKDLMSALPLGEYTHRDGLLNLAARLPDIFCKPDLGPKMYIAYGSGLHLDKGTTNLHLDVSDAVNVMVHVGVVKDDDTTEHDKAVMKAIEDSDCDYAMIRRVVEYKELPGALWHIWEAKDADKIRDMMNKVSLEKGFKVEPHHDAIHDQSCYLDSAMRRRLREDYNVVGYPILQCEGDAVFIPAGAPHQVRNLNNCIKIAEDFVSPENVGHCFYLTEEFRNLTETHTNHEDKLQIKNIVYHTVKDAVAVIKKESEQDA